MLGFANNNFYICRYKNREPAYLSAVMKPANLLLKVLLAAILCPATASAYHTADTIGEIRHLDELLESADDYVAKRKLRLMTLENMLHSRGVSLEQQFGIYGQLYDEYVTYQFDEAVSVLDKRMELAERLGDSSRMADVTLQRAMLFTTSGMFLEASVLLSSGLDTLSLDRKQLLDYYNTQHRFYKDYNEYRRTPRASKGKVRYYRDRILECAPPESEVYQQTAIHDAMDAGDFETACARNLELLSRFDPSSHKYAVHAYDQAVICDSLGYTGDMIVWYARSAAADVEGAIKDNASLCNLAQAMLHRGDIDRAFDYITISLNDALFYNAKLRPWQIANVIPMIERSYQDMQALQNKRMHKLLVVISILAVVMLGICLLAVYLHSRTLISRRKIEQMNNQIKEANASLLEANENIRNINNALLEANRAKEKYIGLFLTRNSDYVDKLDAYRRNVRRKLLANKYEELKAECASSEMMDRELNEFYEMCDNAFLQLYPNFVKEFNELLKPEAQIELKKGERLNTELRIFALIRLGITDSSRIASLLRYSINTIYNYRARIRNSAAVNRDDFEERVKTIGMLK